MKKALAQARRMPHKFEKEFPDIAAGFAKSYLSAVEAADGMAAGILALPSGENRNHKARALIDFVSSCYGDAGPQELPAHDVCRHFNVAYKYISGKAAGPALQRILDTCIAMHQREYPDISNDCISAASIATNITRMISGVPQMLSRTTIVTRLTGFLRDAVTDQAISHDQAESAIGTLKRTLAETAKPALTM